MEIPEGWKNSNILDSSIQIIDGDRGKAYPSQEDFLESGHCLFLNAKNVTKDGFAFSKRAFISSNKDSQLRKGKLSRGDLILTTRGTVGNIAYFDDHIPYDNIRINSGMVVLRNNGSLLNIKFLYILFRSNIIRRQIKNLSFGSAQPQLTVKVIGKIKVPLPPLVEQKRIAEILSTWDRAIEVVEELIENSRVQKNALMQQLLTGKKRLPGFYGEWETAPLTDVVRLETGSSNREDSSNVGEFTFFDRSTDIRRSHRFLFDTEAIIIGGEGQEFIPKYFIGKFDLHQRAYAVSGFEKTDGKYVFYSIYYNRHLLRRFSVGSTVASLRMGTFQKLPIRLISKKEQTAIASILTDADHEVEILTKQLTNLKSEKSALMQQLLTGKRRVKINKEAANA